MKGRKPELAADANALDAAEKKRAAQWPPSRRAVSAIAVYAAALIRPRAAAPHDQRPSPQACR
jgi:hypothetical protein